MKELYIVKRNIRYHHPTHPLSEELITPDMPEAQEGLPMDHLDKIDLALLIRKGILVRKLNIEESEEESE